MKNVKEAMLDAVLDVIYEDIRLELIRELTATINEIGIVTDNKSFYIHEDMVSVKEGLWKKRGELRGGELFEIPDWAEERVLGRTKQVITQLLYLMKE